jgi:hypothetical protein
LAKRKLQWQGLVSLDVEPEVGSADSGNLIETAFIVPLFNESNNAVGAPSLGSQG